MEKLYNNKGQVAVAVSYGFGAGWSTWEDVDPMDKKYNELIDSEQWEELYKLLEKENIHSGGIADIELVWLDKGTEFIITEYDGAESIEYKDKIQWLKV